ncbi:MAG: hypothetical protein QM532_03005 [Cyanobium sp. MAG06]|nr:hypothetical protein [Cyanobium sp. MAG06]
MSGNIAYNNTFSTNTRFVFYGIEGENRGIKITFEYTLSNGQIFKKSFNDSVSIYKSALNMEVVPNQKSATIIENNKYAFTVKVKNISQEELNNPILSIILPRSFILDRNSEFKDSNNIKLNSIKQGESKNFNFSGYFSELSSDDRVFRAVLYTDTNILLKDAILEAKNIKAPFSLEINYIKDFTEIQDIKRKTPYELKLSLHNNSEDPYTNIFVNFKDSNLEKRLNINPLSIGVDRTEYVSVDIVTPDYDEYQFNMLVTGRKKGIFEDDVLLSRNITTQLLK